MPLRLWVVAAVENYLLESGIEGLLSGSAALSLSSKLKVNLGARFKHIAELCNPSCYEEQCYWHKGLVRYQVIHSRFKEKT